MKKKYDLVVVGELNVDMIVSGLDSLPALGTEKIASGIEIVLGGSAAIFACGVASCPNLDEVKRFISPQRNT